MTKKRNMKSHQRNREGGTLWMNSEKGKSKKRAKEREKTDIEILFAFVASGAVHAMWKKADQ